MKGVIPKVLQRYKNMKQTNLQQLNTLKEYLSKLSSLAGEIEEFINEIDETECVDFLDDFYEIKDFVETVNADAWDKYEILEEFIQWNDPKSLQDLEDDLLIYDDLQFNEVELDFLESDELE